ncbi:PREDICTED: tubulin-specific chaperone D-like, partial [Priapulus caudatus]|uniref:Tubulin-specific chaperone D-like n=1 Tax=Priapulus caudatus TaxID=37621 RepID=A0ABM1F3S1_PRICU
LPSLVPLAMDMDLSTRHGALLSIAELTHALSQEAQRQHRALEHYVSPEVQLSAHFFAGVDAGGSPDSAICSENIPDIMDCFLRAMTDYTHDSRGDVGAWVREAAMLGLKELMLLIAAAEPSLISPQIPPIPHIPHKEELLEIFPRSSSQELNWSAPSEIFPSIVRMLGLRAYLYPVLLGLCVSVGGLTESVVKHSSAAFFAFVNDLAAADHSALCELCATLLAIFGNHQRKSRVTLPMLKMLDQMLINGCLSTLAGHDDASFLLPLSALCTREINKCGDPQKLMSCADVFCGLLQFAGKVRRGALFQLIIFLCHKYPRVRKTTAGKFYEALVTFDDVVAEDRLDDVLTILSETKWDDPINIVRNTRNELCEMLGVPTPKPIARPV